MTMDKQTVLSHAAIMGLAGGLLNATALYLNAPDGSNEEQVLEDELATELAAAVMLGDEAVSNLLLALSSLVVATAPEADVQAWFDNQADRIQEVLDS